LKSVTIGGIISDSYWGKFKTILILSLVYCLGSIVLAVTSFPALSGHPPKPYGAFIGLSLLAFGTGGIKPCVSSFGGDQFHPSQVKELATYFSVFYFSINAGSVLSMFITPILRSNVHWYNYSYD
jgi:dipeptide/tripeptide permease